ncbi:hypothetical protein ABI59_18955 [Acidobacteria bacterium Mor1]|nr:hypothetical protein ABI59_18955 [Acidobacteria bacterium Mor1]
MGKQRIEDLALFGGASTFQRLRPIAQLERPDRARFLAHLSRIDRRGPTPVLVPELEARLARFHDVPHVVAVSNACVGLLYLLHVAAGGKRGEVLMPAMTYAGLPHLAVWAGQTPRFCDVLEATHTLDPESVRGAITPSTTAILPVHNVNSPCEIREFEALSAESGVPLIFDAVHALGSSYAGRRVGSHGMAEVFSLHATKLLNGFEGGYVATRDGALAERLRGMRDAGDCSEPRGLDGRLNEVHAAMALSSLDDLEGVFDRNLQRFERYVRHARESEWLDVLPYRSGEAHNYEFAIHRVDPDSPLTRNQWVHLLRSEMAGAEAYYNPPLHRTAHRPQDTEMPHLPVTDELTHRFMHMPVGATVSLGDIDEIGSLVRFIEHRADEIAARMAPLSREVA